MIDAQLSSSWEDVTRSGCSKESKACCGFRERNLDQFDPDDPRPTGVIMLRMIQYGRTIICLGAKMAVSRFPSHHVAVLFLSIGYAVIPVGISGQVTPAQRAELVLRLLPAQARSDATVLLRDAEGEERYREGTGRFLCVSDASVTGRLSMVCHHHVLEERLRFERELRRETGLRGDAFRERLCNEVSGRELEIPAGAMEITASLARDDDGVYADEMTVYHLLWLPTHTAETIGVVDEDPGKGQPWLHQAGTCGAHVMWSEQVRADGRG